MNKIKEKTNVMRILDQHKIDYVVHDYTNSEVISGKDVAAYFNENEEKVFKTLVTIGKSNTNYVFLVPVNKDLDLKKAASSVNEKNIEMIKSKDLLGLTGYIHGGCSPIGMKKTFKTVIDKTVYNNESIFISGGKIGYQIEIKVDNLKKIVNFITFDITKEKENE